MPITAQGLGYFFSTTDRASPGVKVLSKNIKKLGADSVEAQKLYDRSMKLIKQGTKEMLIGGLGLAAVNNLTDTYGKFEIKLASAGAVMNATALQMKQLERTAINAGIATQFDPREAAEGLENLGAAGMSAQQAMDTLNPVLDLAAASLGQLGVGEAAANVVGVLNAFGDSADNAQKRVDQLVKITQMSNFQARDFSVAISQAAAQASAADQTFESMTATIGLLRNTNLDASSSATAYREAVRRVSGEELSLKELRKLGISTMDKQTGKIKDLGLIMAEVIPAVSKLSSQQKNLTLKTIFGVRGMKTFNAFLASYNKLVKEGKVETGDFAGAHTILVSGLNNASGAASKTRDQLLATAEGQRILMKGSIETFKVVAGKALIPVVLPAIKALTSVLNTLIKVFAVLGPETKGFFSHFIGIGAAMMAVSGAIKIVIGIRGKAIAMTVLQAEKNKELAASEVAVAGATKASNAEQAKKISGYQRMRSGVAGFMTKAASALPFIGIGVSLMSAFFASRRAGEKEEINRQKKIRAEQLASRQAYINTIEVVEKLGKVAERAGEKLVKSSKKNRKVAEQSLGTVRDTIAKNLTTAQEKERELLEIGRKIRSSLLTETEKKRMKQRQRQLRQDILASEKRASVFAVAEMKIRAQIARRTPAFKRTEEQNRDIVTANTFEITKMREKEAVLQKKIDGFRGLLLTKGMKKRRKQLERQLKRMRAAREKFTLKTARLTGFKGKDAAAAGRAVGKFADPRLRELEQFGGVEARTGLGRSTLFQIARGKASIDKFARTPEQRAAIEAWLENVFDPSTGGKFKGRRRVGPAAARVAPTGRGAQDPFKFEGPTPEGLFGATDVGGPRITRAPVYGGGVEGGLEKPTGTFTRILREGIHESPQLREQIAAARMAQEMFRNILGPEIKAAIESAKISVEIDGESVPTENKKRNKRTAEGKPSKPAK
jgi:TP901 family phage tail tape measure protein